MYSSSGGLTIDSCIIAGNHADLGTQVGMQNGTTLSIDCSDVQGGRIVYSAVFPDGHTGIMYYVPGGPAVEMLVNQEEKVGTPGILLEPAG